MDSKDYALLMRELLERFPPIKLTAHELKSVDPRIISSDDVDFERFSDVAWTEIPPDEARKLDSVLYYLSPKGVSALLPAAIFALTWPALADVLLSGVPAYFRDVDLSRDFWRSLDLEQKELLVDILFAYELMYVDQNVEEYEDFVGVAGGLEL